MLSALILSVLLSCTHFHCPTLCTLLCILSLLIPPHSSPSHTASSFIPCVSLMYKLFTVICSIILTHILPVSYHLQLSPVYTVQYSQNCQFCSGISVITIGASAQLNCYMPVHMDSEEHLLRTNPPLFKPVSYLFNRGKAKQLFL